MHTRICSVWAGITTTTTTTSNRSPPKQLLHNVAAILSSAVRPQKPPRTPTAKPSIPAHRRPIGSLISYWAPTLPCANASKSNSHPELQDAYNMDTNCWCVLPIPWAQRGLSFARA